MERLRVVAMIVCVVLLASCGDDDSTCPTCPDLTGSPLARIDVSPEQGSPDTIFTFDASGSLDTATAAEDLQVRWDWEGDGVWDTDYATVKTATHQFATVATYAVHLQVKDADGLVGKAVLDLEVGHGTVTDIDGNVYRIVKIGEQYWLDENLRTSRYRNGDALATAASNGEWTTATVGMQCAYDNNVANAMQYGLLYNFRAVTDSRGLAPEGWHVATDEDWNELEAFLGIPSADIEERGDVGTVEGGWLKEVGTDHWYEPNVGATDAFGFAARGGGGRDFFGDFTSLRGTAQFWTGTPSGTFGRLRMLYGHLTVIHDSSDIPNLGMSVRCVRD